MNIKILRIAEKDSDPQMGVFYIEGKPRFITLELPWRNNEKSISCIPVGKYKAKRVNSPRFGKTFKILNVPNRSEILIHPGNEVKDTQGCILVGNRILDFDFISGSRDSFRSLMELLIDVNEFNLEIKSA